ncbi:fumarylacetoacetate hydrolase family protein [Ferrovibrio sp.]|uniref:fumarylacetoacetate hydrolase family protein n=1 Tax=Ferrovibrio sp. TaxID=1917215 RepID=UPI0035AE74CD
MRIVSYLNPKDNAAALALRLGNEFVALPADAPRNLLSVIQSNSLSSLASLFGRGTPLDPNQITLLPPLAQPPKIVCIGLNYADHTKESPYEQPNYPTIFTRFASSLIGHGAAIIRPKCSEQLDFEGEMVAVIGKGGRHITREQALDHVIGYSVFNDVSVRDYQFKSPQWTVGKNFDASGPFGPDFVTADELPPGGSGLKLETRLNGQVVQSANTSDMLFNVRDIIATLSEAITLEPGDVLVTGTPAGVGFARKPPLFMKHGDIIEVEIEGIGLLSNPVQDEK